MESKLARALSDAAVRRLAGPKNYRKGLDYYEEGAVISLKSDATSLRAVVRGSQDYAVFFVASGSGLVHDCDCPKGSIAEFCKHCVAAALAWLKQSNSVPATRTATRRKAKQVTLSDAARLLNTEPPEALVAMLLDWAKDDERLHARLIQYAARRSGPEAGIAVASRAFDHAVSVDGFVPYREAAGWAHDVDQAIDNFSRLLEDGHAAAVVDLAESAIRKLLKAIESVDDSDGYFSTLRDRLQDIHFRACGVAKPDPIALARRLFELELRSSFDVFSGSAERYARILGAKGLQELRNVANVEWRKVPARAAGDKSSSGHFQITEIMKSLARVSGDIEELVAIMTRDLSFAYNYLKIAEVYREAGQRDQAIAWAEKGLAAFPDRTDIRLREFAADEYHRQKRHDDAMRLVWAEFLERPYPDTYQFLERHAKKAGDWPAWRERALAEIKRTPQKDSTRLVEIYLYEKDTEAAWHEAQAGGCSDRHWLQLAKLRETHHPADVSPIYLNLAEASVRSTQNGRYEDGIDLLKKAAAVMKRLGRSREFVNFLEALRTKYKIKRNFIKLVEAKRKFLYLN